MGPNLTRNAASRHSTTYRCFQCDRQSVVVGSRSELSRRSLHRRPFGTWATAEPDSLTTRSPLDYTHRDSMADDVICIDTDRAVVVVIVVVVVAVVGAAAAVMFQLQLLLEWGALPLDCTPPDSTAAELLSDCTGAPCLGRRTSTMRWPPEFSLQLAMCEHTDWL